MLKCVVSVQSTRGVIRTNCEGFLLQMLKKWETRERKKMRDYEKERDREDERKAEEVRRKN